MDQETMKKLRELRNRVGMRVSKRAMGGGKKADDMATAMDDCASACDDCSWLCSVCIDYCVQTGHSECIRPLKDALDCCRCCASMCRSKSDLCAECCKVCFAACEACAKVCRAIEGDEYMSACADACDECIECCAMVAGETRSAVARDEVRSCRVDVRSASSGREINGYPIVFNELSQDLGGFRERILPGAVQFTEDVRADFNHNPDYILGRLSAGTLTLESDARGVRMKADAPETTWANDLLVSIKRGDIDQGSFAFRVLPGGQTFAQEDGVTVRTLSKILVSRVSVVSDPAYIKTSVQARSIPTEPDPTAGQAAPPADSGAVDIDHLRRYADMVTRG